MSDIFRSVYASSFTADVSTQQWRIMPTDVPWK